ncbi:MAG: hypothetical protein AAF226_08195 [Verrucomicrobiota bacterium]
MIKLLAFIVLLNGLNSCLASTIIDLKFVVSSSAKELIPFSAQIILYETKVAIIAKGESDGVKMFLSSEEEIEHETRTLTIEDENIAAELLVLRDSFSLIEENIDDWHPGGWYELSIKSGAYSGNYKSVGTKTGFLTYQFCRIMQDFINKKETEELDSPLHETYFLLRLQDLNFFVERFCSQQSEPD